jgi:hypothetical protein
MGIVEWMRGESLVEWMRGERAWLSEWEEREPGWVDDSGREQDWVDERGEIAWLSGWEERYLGWVDERRELGCVDDSGRELGWVEKREERTFSSWAEERREDLVCGCGGRGGDTHKEVTCWGRMELDCPLAPQGTVLLFLHKNRSVQRLSSTKLWGEVRFKLNFFIKKLLNCT